LFDVNRTLKFAPLLRQSAYVATERLTPTAPQTFRFTVIANANDDTEGSVERSIAPGQLKVEVHALNSPYPSGIFSNACERVARLVTPRPAAAPPIVRNARLLRG
jgi:hypothetical protein